MNKTAKGLYTSVDMLCCSHFEDPKFISAKGNRIKSPMAILAPVWCPLPAIPGYVEETICEAKNASSHNCHPHPSISTSVLYYHHIVNHRQRIRQSLLISGRKFTLKGKVSNVKNQNPLNQKRTQLSFKHLPPEPRKVQISAQLI